MKLMLTNLEKKVPFHRKCRLSSEYSNALSRLDQLICPHPANLFCNWKPLIVVCSFDFDQQIISLPQAKSDLVTVYMNKVVFE